MKGKLPLVFYRMHRRFYVTFIFFFLWFASFFTLLAEDLTNKNFFQNLPLPFELGFHPQYTSLTLKQDSLYKFYPNLKVNYSQFHTELKPISTSFLTYDLVSPLPYIWKTYNLIFELPKQNFIYSSLVYLSENWNYSFVPEFYSFQIGFSYKFSNWKWLSFISAGIKLGFQQVHDFTLSEKQRKLEQRFKTSFFTQGIFLNTRGILIEGLVRMPLQESSEHEILSKPEFFGRFGLYWNLPDKIQP